MSENIKKGLKKMLKLLKVKIHIAANSIKINIWTPTVHLKTVLKAYELTNVANALWDIIYLSSYKLNIGYSMFFGLKRSWNRKSLNLKDGCGSAFLRFLFLCFILIPSKRPRRCLTLRQLGSHVQAIPPPKFQQP